MAERKYFSLEELDAAILSLKKEKEKVTAEKIVKYSQSNEQMSLTQMRKRNDEENRLVKEINKLQVARRRLVKFLDNKDKFFNEAKKNLVTSDTSLSSSG